MVPEKKDAKKPTIAAKVGSKVAKDIKEEAGKKEEAAGKKE